MSRDTLIKDTERILTGFDYEKESKGLVCISSEGCIPLSRDYIALYADEACIEACQKLYDLNIQTINSGANTDGRDGITYEAFIGISYDTLSDENKLIANNMIKEGIIGPIISTGHNKERIISIRVPLTSRSTVGEISDKLMTLANYFTIQDVLYGRYTRDEFERKYKKLDNGMYLDYLTFTSITEEEKNELIDYYLSELYYDGKEYYYFTEDLLRKYQEFLKNKTKLNVKTIY